MSQIEIKVPDIGGSEDVDVIELCVAPGDKVEVDTALIVLESDKSTMEIPSPSAGTVVEMRLAVGDKVSEGSLILLLEAEADTASAKPESPVASSQSSAPSVPVKSGQSQAQVQEQSREQSQEQSQEQPPSLPSASASGALATAGTAASTAVSSGSLYSVNEAAQRAHAGPAVRKLAREFGVDLSQVRGTAPHGRIVKEDVQTFVKLRIKQAPVASGGSGIPSVKLPDFSVFGETDRRPLSKIGKITAENMQRAWLNVPHVTQFDEADITELEEFRKAQKSAADAKGMRLTPLPFLLKASALALKAMPQFNVSLDMDTSEIVQKHYIHIGFAVDTPDGLMVPVIRDVDKKSLWELAGESSDLAGKARDKKLLPREMQGGCFTITSLGGIGGTAFTPIVNTPEVAILGVSKASLKPVWNGQAFAPRLMLPLSLSYDHRAVNGADGARLTTLLVRLLSDIRQMLL
jgi:pyruvate dehydrogenase E2 component (dihydrolipoamide acetyltransferase)